MLPDDKRTQLDGIVQQMTTDKQSPQNIQAVVDDFKQKYSQNAFSPQAQKPQPGFSSPLTKMDPTGEQGKAAVAGALPLAGSIAGSVIGGAAATPETLGLGTLPGAVAGAAVGGAAGTAANQAIQGAMNPEGIAKAGLEFGAMEAVGGPLASIAGKAVEGVGETAAKMFIPKSDLEAGMLQLYKSKPQNSLLNRIKSIVGLGKVDKVPTTAASAAFDQGIAGTESMMGVQAKKAQTKLWDNTIEPALTQVKGKVNLPSFFKQAEAKIVSETPDPTRQKALLNALDSVKEDFKGVKNTGVVSFPKFQEYKEGWADWVPDKAYKGQNITAAINDVRNTLAGMAREQIYKAVPENVKQAYLDYGSLKGIVALGRKAMAGGPIKAGGTGTTIKNLFEMATVPIGTLGGQTIYKLGQGIELAGPSGVKTLGALLGVGAANTGAPTSSPPPAPSSTGAPPPSIPVSQQLQIPGQQ